MQIIQHNILNVQDRFQNYQAKKEQKNLTNSQERRQLRSRRLEMTQTLELSKTFKAAIKIMIH